MVSAYTFQPPTTFGTSGLTSLHSTTSFPTTLLSNIWSVRPFDLPAPGSAISPSYNTSDTLLCTITEEPNTSSNMGRPVDSFQPVLWDLDGYLPSRRDSPNPGVPE